MSAISVRPESEAGLMPAGIGTLEEFLRWFLAQPLSALCPPIDAVWEYGTVRSLVLFRQPPYQVELFTVPPGETGEESEHRHPNVDQFQVYLSGEIDFRVNGRSVSEGMARSGIREIRLRPTDWHTARYTPAGGAFLSVQRWPGGVGPTSVGMEWEGPFTHGAQAALHGQAGPLSDGRGAAKAVSDLLASLRRASAVLSAGELARPLFSFVEGNLLRPPGISAKPHDDTAVRLVPPPRRPSPRVFVLTFCKNMDLLGGTTLVFNTIRTGFPTADLVVVDNASLPEARIAIKGRAEAVGARFLQLENEVTHWNHIANVISSQGARGPLVLVDPDIIFWESIEDWDFGDALLAGRLLPAFRDEITGTVTQERLHTSLWWIPNAPALNSAAGQLVERFNFWAATYGSEFDPFVPVVLPDGDGGFVRWDTGAAVYAALKEKCHVFTEKELNAYDHVFGGTDLDRIAKRIPAERAEAWEARLRQAISDPTPLRGMWRDQDAFFRAWAVAG